MGLITPSTDTGICAQAIGFAKIFNPGPAGHRSASGPGRRTSRRSAVRGWNGLSLFGIVGSELVLPCRCSGCTAGCNRVRGFPAWLSSHSSENKPACCVNSSAAGNTSRSFQTMDTKNGFVQRPFGGRLECGGISPEYPLAAVVPLVAFLSSSRGFSFSLYHCQPASLAKAGIRAQQRHPASMAACIVHGKYPL